MSAPRRWVRRAVLFVLTGGGLTAAGIGWQAPPQAVAAGSSRDAHAPGSRSSTRDPYAKTTSTASSRATASSTQAISSSLTSSTSTSTTGSSSTTASTTQTSSVPSTSTTSSESASTTSSGSSSSSSTSSSTTSTTQTSSTSESTTQQAPPVIGRQRQQGTSGAEGGRRGGEGGSNNSSRSQGGAGKRNGGQTVGSGKHREGAGGGRGAGGHGSGNVAPPPQLAASQAETLSALLGAPSASIQALDYYRIPMFLLPIYQSAAVQYGVPWEVLAAINEVETDYGNDLAISTAGAVGWMQFMPETWLRYGVDVQNAGYADPYNPVDAIFAAARYLKAAGASKSLRSAIFAYNHSNAYVESVLLRAKLIAHYPSDVIATLTGLAEGTLPVPGALATGESLLGGRRLARRGGEASPGEAAATGGGGEAGRGGEGSEGEGEAEGAEGTPGSTVAPSPQQSAAGIGGSTAPKRFVDLAAAKGAPVVAVQDGKIIAKGASKRLGRYIVLRDVYGDVFTYAGLGRISRTYSPPKLSGHGHIPGVVVAGASAASDPSPSSAATEGTQPPLTLKAKGAGASPGASKPGEAQSVELGSQLGKVRMYARPKSAYAHAVIARARKDGLLVGQRLPLKVGSVVSQGTVLGATALAPSAKTGQMRFAVSPAGDSGTVAAQPVLQSWRQLHAALHPQGATGEAGLIGATAGDAFLLSGEQLRSAVLSDPGISLDSCMRQDISIGAIDARVLSTLVFLSRSGLKPTVGALPCARRVKGGFSMPGRRVRGARDSVEITDVNGIPVAGHEGPGSIVDLTIRTLLTLQGRFSPSEIVSLMHYPGSPGTIARSTHSRSILVVFPPHGAGAFGAGAASTATSAAAGSAHSRGAGGSPGAARGSASSFAGLRAGQWSALLHRVAAIPQPIVTRKRSSAAISDPHRSASSEGQGGGAGSKASPRG